MRRIVLAAILVAIASVATASDEGLEAARRGDFQTAHAIWTNEANAGDPGAAFNLGLLYQNGDGVTKDDGTAAQWYSKAAEAGLARAQFRIGFMYANGMGVEQDLHKAIIWTAMAAKQGHSDARSNFGEFQSWLATYYRTGHKEYGIKQDHVLSYMWHVLAGENAQSYSKGMADGLKLVLTRGELRKANRLIRTCRSSGYVDCG